MPISKTVYDTYYNVLHGMLGIQQNTLSNVYDVYVSVHKIQISD